MTFLRLLRAWAIILPFMIANGMFRELLLKRVVNDAVADILSAVIGTVIVIGLTRIVLRPLAGKSTSNLVHASVTLVVLTVAFEFLFGHYVDRASWDELLANYEIWNGRLWPMVLATLAFMPFLWGHWSLEDNRHVR